MSWQDLVAKVSMSRRELGANEAFLLTDNQQFHIVDSGYVDLFAVMVSDDSENAQRTTKPFVARIMPGNAFFGAPTVMVKSDSQGAGNYVLLAVPSRQTVLFSGARERLFSADDFDLDVVLLIDNWVKTASEFVASYEVPPIAHNTALLDADPDVPYKAHTALSAHHLEILWVTSDQPARFVGRPEFPVDAEAAFPISEHTWLTLSEDAGVSAVHTPGAILAGRIWEAIDRFNAQIVRCGERYWEESVEKTHVKQAKTRRSIALAKMSLTGGLAGLLGEVPDIGRGQAAAADEDMLFAASRIIAAQVGVKIEPPTVPVKVKDPVEAVEIMVGSSGIRTREVKLEDGWERRDGPSFLGGLQDGDESRPVAVVNTGGGAYEIRDPASNGRVPVNRELAKKLGAEGLVFYPPLPEHVNSGLAAVRHVMRGRGRDILGVILMGCLGAVFALLIPILTGKLLAEIIPRVDIPLWSAALGALAIGAFVSAAFAIVGALCMLRLEAQVDESLQAAVWNRLLSLPLPFFGRYLAGDLADRANGVSLIRQLLTGAVGGSILSGMFSVFSYALLFYYSWELALWSGAAVALMAAATWFFAKNQIRHTRTALMIQGMIDALVFQMIRGLAKIRQAHAEAFALERWSGQYLKQKRAYLSARNWGVGQLTFNALFMPATQIALLGLIWFSLLDDEPPTPFALADFLSFYAAFGQFVGGVTGLTAALVSAVSVLPLFERIQPILQARPESVDGRVVLPRPAGQIEFRNISFRYSSAEVDVLRNVSFQIDAGEYVAFVGASGSGKSTLYRLMLGFERPTTGTVLVDGHDLATLNLSSLRQHMGVVLQDGQLLPDNIRNNIAGHSHLTDAQVEEVVRAVGLEEDINALPMKLRTVLPESGAGLSGGQKQRLLVARALAQKPSILLLDEATSMLDNRAQDAVRATLRGLNSTRILIAHRLSTVIDADRIYVMRDGQVVESGGYRELMERDGAMAEMARRQII